MRTGWASRPAVWWAPLTVVAAAAVVTMTVPFGLNGDVRYEYGVQWVSDASLPATFDHRPLLYRLLMAATGGVPAAGLGRGTGAFEAALRAESLLVCAGAAALLWAGLRRVLPKPGHAFAVAVAAGVSLAMAGTGTVWEPDWLAVVLTVAGTGAALAP